MSSTEVEVGDFVMHEYWRCGYLLGTTFGTVTKISPPGYVHYSSPFRDRTGFRHHGRDAKHLTILIKRMEKEHD